MHTDETNSTDVKFAFDLMGLHVCKVCPNTSKDKIISAWTSGLLRKPIKALLNAMMVCKAM